MYEKTKNINILNTTNINFFSLVILEDFNFKLLLIEELTVDSFENIELLKKFRDIQLEHRILNLRSLIYEKDSNEVLKDIEKLKTIDKIYYELDKIQNETSNNNKILEFENTIKKFKDLNL